MEPPRDLRHTSVTERSRAKEACDCALQWAYDVMAESINSSDVHPADHVVDASAPELKVAADPPFLALPTLDGFREWVHGPGATVTSTAAGAGEVKWLPPMALIDLFDLCSERMSSKPSYSTFSRAYNENWKYCLRFRVKIMQSKCDDCERLKLLRKRAATPEHAEAVRAEHLEHVRSTFHDRAVDERIQKAAYDATTTPAGVPLARSILNMDMDAMEAMKFKCPRNLGNAKMLAALWRPQQHMVGSIVDGCTDHFWLVPPDIVKNANLSATLTADLLHQTVALLRQRGVPLPRTFRVHSDNAGGEVKNQTFMKFMAYLAFMKFNSTEMTQFRPGHSHGRIDQAFSVLGTALNKPDNVLQTPDDFQACMEATRGRAGLRPMRVTQMGAMYDWQKFFESLNVAPHSHAQTHAMKVQNREACHVFRFFRRDSQIPGGSGEAVVPHTIFEDAPAGDDIILVTKHLLCSESYAQEPCVFCPGVRFRALPREGPGIISGRMEFSPRQQKEFMKTAAAVKQSPWNMHRSEDWLKAILEANRNGFSPTWVPPTISWVVSGDLVGCHPLLPIPRALPSATPVPVAMEDMTGKRRRLKRKTPQTISEVLAPAARRIKTSQRDQNLAAPSAAQSVAGAPPPMVTEAGAPANVVAPRVRPPRVFGPVCAAAMHSRTRNRLLVITTEPNLGCGRCRHSAVGCGYCRRIQMCWRHLHGQCGEALP